MAVVNVKSAALTNRDATPRVPNLGAIDRAQMFAARGLATITSGDSAASVYRLCTIPSDAIVLAVWKSHPDIGTTTTADIGLYKTTRDGSAVVDADAFTAATVLNAGAVNKTDVGHGNLMTVANFEKRVWELLGLTADPFIDYDVCATLVGAADGTGALALEVEYVV